MAATWERRRAPLFLTAIVGGGVVGLLLPRAAAPLEHAIEPSLVVLPLALALPPTFALAPLAVVTQTLVELIAMVVLVPLLPRIIRTRHAHEPA